MRNPERLKGYVALISKRHGIEKVIGDLAQAQTEGVHPRSGFEMASAEPSKAEGMRGLESLALGREPTQEQRMGVEAIIDEDLRPAFDIVDGTFQADHPLWLHLSRDAATKKRIEGCLPSIGRVELPGHPRLPYAGTGFVVGKDLLMTNRHVAEVFASGLGDKRIVFRPGLAGGVDFLREQGRAPGPTLRVRKVVMIHPYWDMAVLEIPGISKGRETLPLSLTDARDLVAHPIFVVGYPAFDPRNPVVVQDDLFNHRYGIKRLQPGELQGGAKTASFGKIVLAASHDCSTLGGNSGSAVVDLETGHVLALHFGGAYHERNYGVPSAALSRDSRVIDAGVVFAGTPPGGPNDWSSWWARADEGEAPVVATAGAAAAPAGRPAVSDGGRPAAAVGGCDMVIRAGGGAVTIRVAGPVEIDVGSMASGQRSDESPMSEDSQLEGLREPFHDADYTTRTGYDEHFLGDGSPVPLPTAADAGAVAKTRDGDKLLHYQNFSVVMHAKRRMALFAASNISREPALRKPDPREKYGRKDLAGLGANDQEKWFIDTRLDAKYQLPDVFFTKDRQAFDKGHIVRRDDVAWGATYDELRRANGDSYHVTNCSPQVADFNRSNLGSENWGDLENHVLGSAASERLCVFAGPVLSASDEVFVGVGDGGAKIRAKIPQRYWKVIVCLQDDGVAAFGFVLEQDLAQVEWEFAVPEEFEPVMHPIANIEQMTGVDFGSVVKEADQYGSVTGTELALALQGIRIWKP